jgi:hypothetical protein
LEAAVLALLLSAQANGTSIVVKVKQQRIILAADTLQGVLTEQSRQQPTSPHNSCKIVVLGKVAFAALGHPSYERVNIIKDPVESWDAYDDARNTYDLHPKDIQAMAEDWGKEESDHFARMYSHWKEMVVGMAADSDENLLLRGVFAGWNKKGNAELIFMSITLNGSYIEHTPHSMPARSLPYSPNNLTKLMIESSVPNSKAVQREWASKSKDFPKEERDWRELEFFIQTTSDYQSNVGKDVDVVELTPSGTKWLQKKACLDTTPASISSSDAKIDDVTPPVKTAGRQQQEVPETSHPKYVRLSALFLAAVGAALLAAFARRKLRHRNDA